MIAHALTIVKNGLDRHLATIGGNAPHAELGNVGEVTANPPGNGAARNEVLLSIVNIQRDGHVLATTTLTVVRSQPTRILTHPSLIDAIRTAPTSQAPI